MGVTLPVWYLFSLSDFSAHDSEGGWENLRKSIHFEAFWFLLLLLCDGTRLTRLDSTRTADAMQPSNFMILAWLISDWLIWLIAASIVKIFFLIRSSIINVEANALNESINRWDLSLFFCDCFLSIATTT